TAEAVEQGPQTEKARGNSHGPLHQFPAITYSRVVDTTIGPGCLTAVFGMGTGVSSQVCSPESRLGSRPDRCIGSRGFANPRAPMHRSECSPVSQLVG